MGSRASAAIVVAVLLAFALTACGGERTRSKPGGLNGPIHKKGSRTRADKATTRHEAARPRAEASASPLDFRREALKRIPAAQRVAFASTAARAVLSSLGFPHAAISAASGGRLVVVTLRAAEACAAGSAAIGRIPPALKRTIVYATAVRVEVYGGESASRYARHCPQPELLSGDGPVVYSASGKGLREGREFEVSSERWRLSFRNRSGRLEIYVSEGDQLREPVVKRSYPGTGSVVYSGSGTFRVTVAGSGNWQVRAYDGT
jgi:hypothetical protein